MIRKIIRIDKEKCNGCGACADACHEGAIDIIDGKAELVREHFCDGLGDCLPECPTGAISFEEREAPEYDEEAVKEAQKKIFAKKQAISSHAGCPGSKIMQIQRRETPDSVKPSSTADSVSKLQNWPVQIKLAPVHAPYFNGAKLLIAADCTAYAYASFHQDFIRNKTRSASKEQVRRRTRPGAPWTSRRHLKIRMRKRYHRRKPAHPRKCFLH